MSERPTPSLEEIGEKQKTEEVENDNLITKLTADDYKVPVPEEGSEIAKTESQKSNLEKLGLNLEDFGGKKRAAMIVIGRFLERLDSEQESVLAATQEKQWVDKNKGQHWSDSSEGFWDSTRKMEEILLPTEDEKIQELKDKYGITISIDEGNKGYLHIKSGNGVPMHVYLSGKHFHLDADTSMMLAANLDKERYLKMHPFKRYETLEGQANGEHKRLTEYLEGTPDESKEALQQFLGWELGATGKILDAALVLGEADGGITQEQYDQIKNAEKDGKIVNVEHLETAGWRNAQQWYNEPLRKKDYIFNKPNENYRSQYQRHTERFTNQPPRLYVWTSSEVTKTTE